ncbi:hypothetical protein [Massilia glaciei]|uniref:Lipoprotein n=1 Tax=Massilia glaciei TaxID=1524097 RepID=A0A2U2HDM9_9BURK|nr:hypothetical protein [Massilia glaciei]PWF41232.1 hypothetical protein C7C56_025260 [Massilia glaciei]
MYYLKSTLLAIALAMLSAGCTTPPREFGRDFSTAQFGSIVLGQTTRPELIALLGTPARETVNTYRKDMAGKELPSPLIVHDIEYWFSSNDPLKPPIEAALFGRRNLHVYTVADKVTGMHLNSSFKSDSTNFDTSKIGEIKKHESTMADVNSLFGAPSGTAIYPLAAEQGGRIMFYSFNRINLATNMNETKSMTIQIGGNQRVHDFNLREESEKRPVLQAPAQAPIIISIYIPASR